MIKRKRDLKILLGECLQWIIDRCDLLRKKISKKTIDPIRDNPKRFFYKVIAPIFITILIFLIVYTVSIEDYSWTYSLSFILLILIMISSNHRDVTEVVKVLFYFAFMFLFLYFMSIWWIEKPITILGKSKIIDTNIMQTLAIIAYVILTYYIIKTQQKQINFSKQPILKIKRNNEIFEIENLSSNNAYDIKIKINFKIKEKNEKIRSEHHELLLDRLERYDSCVLYEINQLIHKYVKFKNQKYTDGDGYYPQKEVYKGIHLKQYLRMNL